MKRKTVYNENDASISKLFLFLFFAYSEKCEVSPKINNNE